MKTYSLLPIVLVVLLLTACNNDKTNTTTQTEETDTTTVIEPPDTQQKKDLPDKTTKSPADTQPIAPVDGSTEPPKTTTETKVEASLDGTWELDFVSGPKIAFEGLYPDKKPTMSFNVSDKRVSGNTSCNNFRGNLKTEGNHVNFIEPFIMTKMACSGQGESVFLETLKKVNKYSIDGNTLTFIMGDVSMMRFRRK